MRKLQRGNLNFHVQISKFVCFDVFSKVAFLRFLLLLCSIGAFLSSFQPGNIFETGGFNVNVSQELLLFVPQVKPGPNLPRTPLPFEEGNSESLSMDPQKGILVNFRQGALFPVIGWLLKSSEMQ